MAISIGSNSILTAYYNMSSLVSNSSTTFSEIDASSDDAITEDELSSYISLNTSSSLEASSVFRSMDSDGDGSVSEDEYSTFAETQSQRLESLLSSQELITNLKLSMVKAIGTNSSDSTTKVSAADTAAAIIGKYTENLSENVAEIISALEVEA